MKNLILGSVLGLLVALAAIFLYEKLQPIIFPPGAGIQIKTIIGISGTVMEGATIKPNVDVKLMDASNSTGAQLFKETTSAIDASYNFHTVSVERSAIVTFADIGKNYVLAFVEFAPLKTTPAYAENFDFSDIPEEGTNRVDITLNGASSAYAVKLNALNANPPESQSNNWIARGGTASFVDAKKATHYSLQINRILPDGRMSASFITKDFWIKSLPKDKDVVMYVTVNGLL